MTGEQATVVGVSADGQHRFSKTSTGAITLLEGLGARGDAHAGVTVQHRSRVAVDPTQPNLRQVHLIHAELFAELMHQGFQVQPGQLGENITTTGLDLLDLPRGTHLHIGSEAVLEVTGLRNPCAQINTFRPGLLNAVLRRDQDGALVRKAGIMSIAVRGGVVRPSDPIAVRLPTGPFQRLERV
jgi:MOSC domain-containing protein YiiM